jgi:hypothetical protein
MRTLWRDVEPLMNGTHAMRVAPHLMPRWPNEEHDSYTARVQTATLFPAYRRTISVMAGKPFSKPLTLSDDTPELIAEWANDIDLEGVNLHAFAAEMLQESLAFGLAGILVDAPPPVATDSPIGPTVADQQRAGVRPYFVRVRHDQVLGWRMRTVAGRAVLTQLRLAETDTIEDGAFGEKVVQRVRILEPGSWRLFEKSDKGEWFLHSEGSTSLDVIPFVPLYGQRKAFMQAELPLLDLAYLNIKHWQSQSDQDTILHVARVPILAIIGAQDDTPITIGAQSAVKLPQGADMKFVEHSGAAIAAGKDSLAQLEAQMIQTGAELLVARPGQRSATEAANDAEANKSDLQRITEGFEDSIDLALYFMARYAGLPTGGNASLFKDFAAATLSEASASIVQGLQQGGLITKETALRELQRRGVLSSDLDVQAEIQGAADEGPMPPEPVEDDDALAE